MKKQFLLIVLFALILASCNTDPDNPVKPLEVSGADISNSYYLGYIQGSPGDLPCNLVKILGDDLPAEQVAVDFLDENGDPFGESFVSVYVADMVTISHEYTVLIGNFEFELEDGLMSSSTLLLNTITGAVYDLEGQFAPSAGNTYMGSRYYQQDREGRIYYIAESINRLVTEPGGQVSVERYMDYPFDTSEGYFVDPDANIFFDVGQRVKAAGGGIMETGSRHLGFQGFDGRSYVLEGTLKPDMYLYVLSIDEGLLAHDTVCEQLGYFESYYWNLNYFGDSVGQNHIFLAPNLMEDYSEGILLPFGILYSEQEEQFYEVDFPELVPERIEIFGIEDSYYWVRSRDNPSKFYRIDLEDYILDADRKQALFSTASEYIIPPNLEIQTIYFNVDRVIEFEAYDLQQEIWVKGFISALNGLEYWARESALGSTVLKRIR